MVIPRPSEADVAAAARHFGFHFEADELATFTAAAGHMLTSYDAVEELYHRFAGQTRPSGPIISRPTIPWAPGMSLPTSHPVPTDHCQAGGWRSRTTSPSPGSR
ncbi:amidase domain protein [Mycobacterium xenopi 4042]|uniref:Amidase domain protein n=1 Tax=Mycobacterium xenopi 4042 TaxID=1299334 RepID=X8AI27_MYCXE|nr:amidase domain protein [Mycobacterium xenopi 4042]